LRMAQRLHIDPSMTIESMRKAILENLARYEAAGDERAARAARVMLERLDAMTVAK